ncbi:MAG: hypothetical protein ABR608_13895 [Pseudonocardiaceae bacterium]
MSTLLLCGPGDHPAGCCPLTVGATTSSGHGTSTFEPQEFRPARPGSGRGVLRGAGTIVPPLDRLTHVFSKLNVADRGQAALPARKLGVAE